MPSTEVRASIPKRWFESGVIERSRRDDDPMAILSVSRCLCGDSEVPSKNTGERHKKNTPGFPERVWTTLLAIGRKNWLFTGSPAGGHAAARRFSLIASAHLHRVEPLAYLHHIIRRLPATPISQLDQFLPDRWAETNAKS